MNKPIRIRFDADYPLEDDLLAMEERLVTDFGSCDAVRGYLCDFAEMSLYASVKLAPFPGEDELMVYFSTGGWSGSEEFISRLLAAGKPRGMVRVMHLYAWIRGGGYWFDVAPRLCAGLLMPRERPENDRP